MQNKSNIVTPYQSFRNLNTSLDSALTNLDEACEHFTLAVIPEDYEQTIPDPTKYAEYTAEVHGYVLMVDHLLNHPLIEVIKGIRDESVVQTDSTQVLAVKNNIKAGQVFVHYKGTPYKVLLVAKHSNHPSVKFVSYQSIKNIEDCEKDPNVEAEIWTLPIAEFARKIQVGDKLVERFQYLPEERIKP